MKKKIRNTQTQKNSKEFTCRSRANFSSPVVLKKTTVKKLIQKLELGPQQSFESPKKVYAQDQF